MADEVIAIDANGKPCIAGIDPDDNDITTARIENTGFTGAVRVAQFVWNSSTLQWEKMTQPMINLGGDLYVTMSDVEKLLAGNYWADQKLEYSDGNVLYVGYNTTHKASEGAETWYIKKFTWTAGLLTRIEGFLVGSWTGRASLAWAA